MQKIKIAATLGVCFCAAALVLASDGGEQVDRALDGMVMYGINRDDGTLKRYDFASGQPTSNGEVHNAQGMALTGIGAAAHIPGFQNIIAFWTDPSAGRTRMLYLNPETGYAATINSVDNDSPDTLGAGRITGAVAARAPVEGQQGQGGWAVFAVQSSRRTSEVDFEIDDDSIVVSEPVAAKVTVLGAAISKGSAYDMPVTVKFNINGGDYTPFGPFGKAVNSNVNEDGNPRSHVFPNVFEAGTPIAIIGRSWIKKNNSYNGIRNSHWKKYMTVNGSSEGSSNVIVLRDGDDVPGIACYLGQGSIVEFVEDYIDTNTGKVTLDVNQVIVLFELGTSNFNSPAADFQDLVVLVTLAKTVEELQEGSGTEGDGSETVGTNQLVRVDHQSTGGAITPIMALNRSYDGLATTDGLNFYATSGQLLFMIDSVAQTETLVSNLAQSQVFGLEFSGSTLMGFDNAGDHLVPFDVQTGEALSSPMNVGMIELGTVIFMSALQDPANLADAFD